MLVSDKSWFNRIYKRCVTAVVDTWEDETEHVNYSNFLKDRNSTNYQKILFVECKETNEKGSFLA